MFESLQSRRLPEDSGGICSFLESNVPLALMSAGILQFSLPFSPCLSMDTVFHIPLVSYEGKKRLAVMSDEDSEGSNQNIILPRCRIRNGTSAVRGNQGQNP